MTITFAYSLDPDQDSTMYGPQEFWLSGEDGYLFSGIWGALVFIFRDLGSKLIVWGIQGALQKKSKKKSHLKGKAFISFDFF